MRDIEEDIKDYEMDDYDGARAKKIRTPSKKGRDALHDRKYLKFRNKTKQANRNKGYSDPPSFYSIQEYKNHKYQHLKNSKKYDIENFRMQDQPNYDGIDNRITLWCTCEPDEK